MAQVTMDSKEYLELIAAQRELERIMQEMIAGFTFEFSPQSYHKYNCNYTPGIPKDVQPVLLDKVVDVCVNNEELMQECYKEGLTCFDLDDMRMTRYWSLNSEAHVVDLMEYMAFQEAYNALMPEETEEEAE